VIVDGQPTDAWSWNFVVDGGEIVQGFGPNQAPDLVRTVDLVDIDEIIQRVERSMYGAFPVSLPETARLTASSMMQTTTVLPQTTIAVPSASALGAAPSVLPAEIVGIELVHETVWDVSGRQWLVPAFRLSTTGGLTATAFAIDASLVEIAEIAEIDVTPSTTPLFAPPTNSGTSFPVTTPPPTTTTYPISDDDRTGLTTGRRPIQRVNELRTIGRSLFTRSWFGGG
jgi:hypothetical protein